MGTDVDSRCRARVGLDVDRAAPQRPGTKPSVIASLDRARSQLDVEYLGGYELANVTLPGRPTSNLGDLFLDLVASPE